MIRRPWIILVTVLLLFVAFCGVVTFRYLNRSHALRDRILDELSVVEGEFSLAGASISPNTLVLRKLAYTTPDSALSVTVDRVSLRASVSNLVRHRGRLASVVQSVSLQSPSVTYRLGRSAPADSVSPMASVPSLEEWTALERVILLGGEVQLESTPDEPWVELRHIEGWLIGGEDDNLEIQLAASLGDTSARMIRIEGEGTLADPSIALRLVLNPLSLDRVALPKTAPVGELQGMLAATGQFSADRDGWDATAQWTLEDAGLVIDEFDGLDVSEATIHGLLENELVTLQGHARFEGDRVDFTGELPLDSALVFRAEGSLDSIHIGRHLGTFAGLPPKHQPRGIVRSDAVFLANLATGRLDVMATAYGDSLWTPGGVFDDIHLDYSWDNRRWELRFDSLATRWYGLDMIGEGRFRPSERIRFLVEADAEGRGNRYRLPEWVAPITNKSARGKVLIRDLPDEGFVIRADARVRDVDHSAFGEFTGRFSRWGYSATLDLYSLQVPDASLTFRKHSNQPLHILSEQPQTVWAWWDPEVEISDRVAGIGVAVRGNLASDSLITVTEVSDEATLGTLHLNTLAWQGPESELHVRSSYRLDRDDRFVGNGQLSASYRDGAVRVDSLSFLDGVSGRGQFNLRDRSMEDVTLSIESLDLGHVIPALTGLSEDRVAGSLKGRLQASGPIASPHVDAHLEVSSGRYGDLNNFWGLLTLDTAEDGRIRVRQGAMGREGTTAFTLIGDYTPARDSLDLYLEFPGSDAATILNVMTGREDLLTGDVRFRGTVHGPLLAPNWSAQFRMHDGRMAGVLFEDVQVDLRGISSSRLGHVVYIDSCRLERAEHYQISISGAAPLNRGAGELHLGLEGNVLELFPQLSSFIEDAEGTGRLNWITTVVAGEPVASRGDLVVADGTMTFADVFPPMEEMELSITVAPDGHAEIERARAVFAGDYPFEVRNLPGDPADSTRLPIRFGLPELDFGILQARSLSSRGIPFRLPGISTTEEYGRLVITGKQGPWLTVSGPADSMAVEGELRLLEARFTYPPVLEGDEDDILAVLLPRGFIFPDDPSQAGRPTPEFIEQARWDVDAYVGHDVHYERFVRGLENAPFLETFSSFLGQIVLDIDLEPTDRDQPVRMVGSLADDSFRLDGTVVSNTGRIEFLDLIFEMERAEVAFDRTSVYPVISMRAATTVLEEGTSRQMFLTLYVIDPITGERRQRGRWGEFTFVLEDDIGSSQEEVLSAMGVGIGDMAQLQDRLLISGAGGIDRAVARRWLAPLEREAADWLGLDLVQVRPQFATNLIGTNPSNLWLDAPADDQRIAANTRTANLFRASRIVLGKYVDRDVFISYTGQFGEEARYASVEDIQLGRLGLLQKWNLEYRLQPISPNFVLEFGWEYENVEDQNNRSARMKYSVVFDLMQLSLRELWRERFR